MTPARRDGTRLFRALLLLYPSAFREEYREELCRAFAQRGGIKVSAIGLVIGLPVTIAAIRVVKANALGFTLQNVTAVLLVIPALIGVAAAASWLPARRAARVDPVMALRAE